MPTAVVPEYRTSAGQPRAVTCSFMHVRFGLHGDGLDLAPANTTVGEILVGPRGLLRLLESDLGIASISAHPAEEVALYRECLAACDHLTRFYHASFAVDPVSTARTLLDWRRQWYLHGWDGAFAGHVAPRLADMAAVETLAGERVPLCQGQRLRRILTLLDTQRTQIERFELLDHADDLPAMWRRLADRFACEAVAEPVVQAAPESDLGKLQALLAGRTPAPLRDAAADALTDREQACSMRGDGSVVVVRALSRDVTAQAVAEAVRGSEDASRAVVIASHDGIILDNAFERVGLPRAGFQHYSPFRAAGQVLKLALALVWEPLDPHRLLQFLIHPVSPLKWDVRTQLAEAVAAEPGVGGPAWREALENIGEDQAQIAFWVTPERHSVHEGAPVDVLSERARHCAAWLGRRLGNLQEDEAKAVYAAASAQAQAFASAVDRLRGGGESRLRKVEVDRLVDEVTRSLPDDSTFPQAGHVPATGHPGNVAQPVDEVFWWDLAPLRLDLAPTFSPAEQRDLAAAGVRLPTPEERIVATTRAWQRPVLNCRRRLVLVVHDEEQGRHPLWGRIADRFSGWQEVRLDNGLLLGEAAAAAVLRLTLLPLATKPLPSKRRWWRLDRPIPARDAESYSSLSKLCYHPHEWVLNYHAKLRGSRIAGVTDGPQLYGSLAHRLFERFFHDNEHWRAMADGHVEQWLQSTIDDLIEKEGSVLLEYGRGGDRQHVQTILANALHRLLAHLRGAGVTKVWSEQSVVRAFPGGQLNGDVDLVLVAESGARAVLDAKWGSQKFRLKEIEQGQHLQLAAYGFALGENEWPASGYYIVTTGDVLAPDEDFFPDARVAAGAAGAETVWNKCLVTRAWRLEQLARGEIEVNAGAEPNADSEPPADGLETRTDPDRFDDFGWLTGVESSQ